MRVLIFTFLVSLAFLGHFAPSAAAQSDTARKIDAFIAPFAKESQFAGVVLASEKGKIIYEKAFGLANADFAIPNTVNTRIGIASITKPMTSVILLRLVEAEKISLSDKLAKYIPDFPKADKITVEMLYRHRSGIKHRVMPPEFETVPYTSKQMVDKIKAAELAFEPGENRMYSSGGFTVLARVLEIASGMSYEDLLKRYVFEPAGMRDSLDFNGARIMERRAQDYFLDADGYRNAALKDYSFLIGAGSVFGTAGDIHRFGAAIRDGKYGSAIRDEFFKDGRFSASGSTNGHRAYIEMMADESYSFVILSNMSGGVVDLVQAGMKEIMTGKTPSVSKAVIPKIDPAANPNLDQFTGTYKNADGGEIEIVNQDGSLYSSDIRLHSIRPDCFFDYRFFGEACFLRTDGKITELRWKGATFELKWTRQ